MYIFGGVSTSNAATNAVQMFNATDKSLIVLPCRMPRACANMKAVLWKDTAILLSVDNCFILDFPSMTWHERPLFKVDVSSFSVTVCGESLYVIGGVTVRKTRSGEAYTYSDEVKSVRVEDIVKSTNANWKHHGKLANRVSISTFGLVVAENYNF